MNYQQSLDYLYGLQRFGVKLGLSNMRALLGRLPELQQPLRCVHVAGTNGKGSVSALLAEIFRHAGLTAGLYTSPHLHNFTERIRIDGKPIGKDELAELTGIIQASANGIPLTFFEATTAVGLLAFHRRAVDFAVIETGLGGRLDATNIVNPDLSLITPIAMDHQEHLGDKLTHIANEKAGILKPGVPVVSGRQVGVVAQILERTARRKGCAFSMAGRDYDWQEGGEDITVQVGNREINKLTLCLAGEHQRDNLAQAVAAACCLERMGISIPEAAMRRAAQTLHWPARLEWWPGDRRILLDVAHNHAGCRCLADYLLKHGLHKVRMILGLSGKRQPADVFAPLQALTKKAYLTQVPGMESVPLATLSKWAEACSVPFETFDSPGSAMTSALQDSVEAGDVVVVCGSLYLVAAVRDYLLKDPTNDAIGFC